MNDWKETSENLAQGLSDEPIDRPEAEADFAEDLGPDGFGAFPFVNHTSYDTRALSALNLIAEATVRKEKSQKTRMLCLILGAFGLIAGFFCYRNNSLIGSLLVLYGALLLYVGITWKRFQLRSSRRQLQRGAQDVVYEFSDEEIACNLSTGIIQRYTYDQIEAVVSTDEWYAIFFDMDHGIVLDKTGFTTGDPMSFKAFIGQHTMLPIQDI